MAGLRIRLADAGDLDAVLELERLTTGAPHWARDDYAKMIDVASPSVVRRVLLVASVDDEVAGFAVGAVAGSGVGATGELESVAVAERYRRQGVGRALCIEVMRWCAGRDACGMDLEVRASSESARHLYRGLGFVEVGRRRSYYREPAEDAILMHMDVREKEISSERNSG